MSVRAGSAKNAAKGCGKNMIRLNSAQMKMRETFLAMHVAARRADPDTSEFCFLCERPGDNRQKGSIFSTVIPCIQPGKPERGLMMDAIYGIWVCAECVKQVE